MLMVRGGPGYGLGALRPVRWRLPLEIGTAFGIGDGLF